MSAARAIVCFLAGVGFAFAVLATAQVWRVGGFAPPGYVMTALPAVLACIALASALLDAAIGVAAAAVIFIVIVFVSGYAFVSWFWYAAAALFLAMVAALTIGPPDRRKPN
ncbi:MAG TPA: hypothetical protein VFA43_12150 [Gemmatimonadaceae bacterium]|nr:hypothetical protein [Gemmatimonadaceae bacterium]